MGRITVKIVIVGAGLVGSTLADRLSRPRLDRPLELGLAARGSRAGLRALLSGAPLSAPAARRVEPLPAGRADEGVLFCWTGTGVSMAANKVTGVRAALCTSGRSGHGPKALSTNAWAAAPSTVPSVASLMTGRLGVGHDADATQAQRDLAGALVARDVKQHGRVHKASVAGILILLPRVALNIA